MMRTRGFSFVMLFAGLALGMACQTTGTTYVPSGTGRTNEALAQPTGPATPAPPLFTAYNLWYEKPDHMYSTGFHVGVMIKAGTPARNIQIVKRGRTNWILFTAQGIPFQMEFIDRHHPGLNVQQFCDRLFTTQTLDELTAGFTEKEMSAVRSGILQPGMSKKAVTVAWGYPPESLTSSLQLNVWLFQENRARKREIMFNEEGRSVTF